MEPWSVFWRSAGAGGCLATLPAPARDALANHWRAVARQRRTADAVLDLATGDGVVPGHMAAMRRDLRLVGIDGAEALPPPPPGVETIAGVPMERLPFPAGAFALVTSQFGIEYGDRPAILREVGRVLRPGGTVSFVIHHRDSEVVARNRDRGAALRWVAFDNRMIERARDMVAGGTPRADRVRMVAGIAAEGAERFPGSSLVSDFARSVQAVVDGGWPPAEGRAVLATLRHRAGMEIARIDALLRCAHDAADMAGLAAALSGIGVRAQTSVMRDPGDGGDRSLAWVIDGTRSA